MKKTLFPMLCVLLCAVLMMISMFLPYATAHTHSLNMFEVASEFDSMFLVIPIFLLLTLLILFAALRKPIPALIFDVLAFVLALIHKVACASIFNSDVEFAAGYTLFLICAVLACAGCIWMIVAKAQEKKAAAPKEETPTV